MLFPEIFLLAAQSGVAAICKDPMGKIDAGIWKKAYAYGMQKNVILHL